MSLGATSHDIGYVGFISGSPVEVPSKDNSNYLMDFTRSGNPSPLELCLSSAHQLTIGKAVNLDHAAAPQL